MIYKHIIKLMILLIFIVNEMNCWQNNFKQSIPTNSDFDIENISGYLNYGGKKLQKTNLKHNKLENAIIKSKVDILSGIFRNSLNRIRFKNKKIDIIFLIDSSSSVGKLNFLSEIKFVKKLLSDFNVSYNYTRVAIVTFSSQGKIIKHVDQLTNSSESNDKCNLLNYDIPKIYYTGGGTYTYGALKEAKEILSKARKTSNKIIFLITDGFSTGRSPVPIANKLKNDNVTIITFGIQTGNYAELYNISTNPGEEHSFLLDSFVEFESLARKALHNDYKMGNTVRLKETSYCNVLCTDHEFGTIKNNTSCCDEHAECTCGTTSGHYACVCEAGYYGTGLMEQCQLCPDGTYWQNWNLCKPCPDINHITKEMPAVNISYCVCKTGFKSNVRNRCEVITCPHLKPPDNGYFVKNTTSGGCGNVLNAACGARCKSGFQLIGSSIRLCQENETWSGLNATCLMRTCPFLKIPYYGMVTCNNIDLNLYFDYTPRNETFMKIYENETLRITDVMPIDTDCNFKCGPGFYLTGSPVRNCLPISKWDGLQTTCKQVLCPILPNVTFGEYDPTDCTAQKMAHGSNCTLICPKGFEMKGPSIKSCTGKKIGVWTNRNKVSKCIDITPPNLICPENFTIPMSDNDNFALIKLFPPPNVTDNSGLNATYWLKPAFKTEGLKLIIGDHVFTYIAIDSFKNKAKCNFTVTVIDLTPPVIDNCIDPPIQYIKNNNETFIDWEDPIIYDNSNSHQLFVNQSLRAGYLGIGIHPVHYISIDPSGNENQCLMNVTVMEIMCNVLESPVNGQSICAKNVTHTWCDVTCNNGYAIYDYLDDTHLEHFQLTCKKDNPKWKYDIIPDCTILEMPESIQQLFTITLDSNTDICNTNETLNTIQENILANLREELCGDQDECEIVSSIPDRNCSTEIGDDHDDDDDIDLIRNKTFYHIVKRDVGSDESNILVAPAITTVVPTTLSPKRDNSYNKKKINMKIRIYTRISKKLNLWNKNVSRTENIKIVKAELRNYRTNERLRKKLESFKININQLKLDELIFCKNGSVFKKNVCVQCPRGTFHNISTNICQFCSIGSYNNLFGSTECISCGLYESTRKTGSKLDSDCKSQCPPGTIAKLKISKNYKPNQHHKLNKSLMPYCRKCSPGEFQSNYNEIKCEMCPENFSSARGSDSVSDCYPLEPCLTEPLVCGQFGKCIPEPNSQYLYSCQCDENYIGSHCEILLNLCLSAPCHNGGQCNQINSTYVKCDCPRLYEGEFCEHRIDQCSVGVCKNGGTCLEDINDNIICECTVGYTGAFCDIKIDFCISSPCESGKCLNTNDGYYCQCQPGFIGKRCHLRPCDYLPCHPNAICIDLQVYPAGRSSYICQCPKGLKGYDCSQIDNPCDGHPCKNNGKCKPNKLRNPLDLNHTTIDDNLYLKFICTCPPYFYGDYCEILTIPDFVMEFPKSSLFDYVEIDGPINNLNEISVCTWIQTSDSFNYGTIISYATNSSDNMFTLTDYNGFVLYVNGSNIITDVTVNDGYWHFVCVAWTNLNGFYEIYLDGALINTGYNLSTNSIIESNGRIIIGQEQDSLDTGFSETESFIGKIAYLDVWDRFLAGHEVLEYYMSCEPYQGNLYAWTDFKNKIKGGIKILSSPFCKACTNQLFISNGYIRNMGTRAFYFCHDGYKLDGPIVRNCLRTSEWSLPEPYCKSIHCGHLSDILNGMTIVKRTRYGEEAIFTCNDGFKLIGQKNRLCLQNGLWSGLNPICISDIECDKLATPIYGTIIYANDKNIITDVLDKYPVGTFAEIQCINNTELIGDNFLTCLDTGLWDIDIPKCIDDGKVNGIDKINTDLNERESTSTENSLIISRPTVSVDLDLSNVKNITLPSSLSIQPLLIPPPYSIDIINSIPEKTFWRNLKKFLYYGCINNVTTISNIHINNLSEFCTIINSTVNYTNLSGFQPPDLDEFKNMDIKLLNFLQRAYNNINISNILIENLFEFVLYGEDSKNIEKFSIIMENSFRLVFSFFIDTIIMDNNLDKLMNNHNFNDNNSITDKIKYLIIKIVSKIHKQYTIDNEDAILQVITTTIKSIEQNKDIVDETKTCNLSTLQRKLPTNGLIKSIMNKQNKTFYTDDIFEDEMLSLDNFVMVYFTCNHGFTLIGDNFTSCMPNGDWKDFAFTCEMETCDTIFQCDAPPPIPMVMMELIVTENSFAIGTKMKLMCKEGYTLYGNEFIECLPSGKWSKFTGKCTKISCNKPKLPIDASIISGRSYLYQDKLQVECEDYTITEIVCQSNGKWHPVNIC